MSIKAQCSKLPGKPLPEADLEHVIKHTLPLWAEAENRSFFITGGTGFFGMWLLESLALINDSANLNMKVFILTRNPHLFSQRAPHLACRTNFYLVSGDIRDFQMHPQPMEYFIHAGGAVGTSPKHESPQEIQDTIVRGTERVLNLAQHCKAKKLLLISSGAVYGEHPSAPARLAEDTIGNGNVFSLRTTYGEGKLAAEHLCNIAGQKHGFETKIARCFTFIGPHLPLDRNFAVGNFIRDVLAGKPVKVTGDGTSIRSYLYASDLVIWLWTILFRGLPQEAYNVGSEKEISIRELALLVATVAGNHLPVEISKPVAGLAGFSRYVPNCEKARSRMNLQEHVGLPEAIQKSIQWLARPL